MSILPKATPAPLPKTKDVRRMAIAYAGVLTVLAVAQLFTFDGWLALIAGFGFPGGERLAYLLGSLIVVTEVFALPFLLGMPLSRAFRWLSMICGWLAALLWLKLSLWLILTDAPVETVGFLGTLVTLMPGWWAVFVSAALAIMAAWASWGMWPATRRK